MSASNPTWPHNAVTSETDKQANDEKPMKASTTTSRDSTFPVELPEDRALHLASNAQFAAYIKELLRTSKAAKEDQANRTLVGLMDLTTLDTSVFDTALSSSSASASASAAATVAESESESATATETEDVPPPNMTRTANAAPAFVSTESALLDLFTELEKTISGERLQTLLAAAWETDALATLKIMWNARSIHLGKGEHESFYRCLGWLFQHHPATLLANLPLLYRRVIAKKAPTEAEDDADTVIVNAEDEDEVPAELRFGVSHGYWKDLLNVLVLAVRDRLTVLEDPREVLNEPNLNVPLRKMSPENRRQQMALRRNQKRLQAAVATHAAAPAAAREAATKSKAKSPAQIRHAKEESMYRRAVARFMEPTYRALHLTVARLFAAQLAKDKKLLGSTDKRAKESISLAAKWAPSLEKFHDKQTCIASTIAELLFPAHPFDTQPEPRVGETPRTAYLREARERYRAEVLAPLRRHLEVVEQAISAREVYTINYSSVPSVAMNIYKDLFAMKDFERFFAHVERAQKGKDPKARISGAVLQPAVLVAQARSVAPGPPSSVPAPTTRAAASVAIKREREQLDSLMLDAQWQSLVQRIRDNGSLPATIAVADVSGSMTSPVFTDKTTPLDTAIGLALLTAEIVPSPFGGKFITFSSSPEIVAAGGSDDTRTLAEKVNAMSRADWKMNTDFNAVFEKLLLPLALKNKVEPRDMVQTIVVISDMQFDAADMESHGQKMWETNHERIRRIYASHGYELPRLVYWNLRANAGSKPVTQDTENVLLVSGYSQGMLRTFMESGGFDLDEEELDDEEADVEEIQLADDGSLTLKQPVKTRKTDPMAGLRKAIAHVAYDGLRVVD